MCGRRRCARGASSVTNCGRRVETRRGSYRRTRARAAAVFGGSAARYTRRRCGGERAKVRPSASLLSAAALQFGARAPPAVHLAETAPARAARVWDPLRRPRGAEIDSRLPFCALSRRATPPPEEGGSGPPTRPSFTTASANVFGAEARRWVVLETARSIEA